ncbi:thiamine pyrophosphate-dependent enzyme [Saccharopolyspora shandongensis]|uniref:thiamine pyrophosphate-dependent enzyme n=1 Tax=Saccharopolyspora shandongensis TaxID=418495 RepID=UPI00342929CE
MFLSSSGLGTMGYAIPAAMGAKLGRPDQDVWAVDGDGCFQMTAQDLATCAAEGIPIKLALIDNSVLGMVRQWQTLFWDKHHSASEYRQSTTDYAGLARSLGCVAFRCDDPAGVEDAILRANAVTDRPVLVDFVVSGDELVWPMVPSGTSNDDILVARDTRPEFDVD